MHTDGTRLCTTCNSSFCFWLEAEEASTAVTHASFFFFLQFWTLLKMPLKSSSSPSIITHATGNMQLSVLSILSSNWSLSRGTISFAECLKQYFSTFYCKAHPTDSCLATDTWPYFTHWGADDSGSRASIQLGICPCLEDLVPTMITSWPVSCPADPTWSAISPVTAPCWKPPGRKIYPRSESSLPGCVYCAPCLSTQISPLQSSWASW